MKKALFPHSLRWLLILLLLAAPGGNLPTVPVRAAPPTPAARLSAGSADEWVVTTAVDENDGSCADGDCSLRDALILADNGDTITFANAYYINLSSQLVISKVLTLDSRGRAVTLNGNLVTRIFNIQATGVVTFNHLTLSNARTDEGGGIYNNGGTVTVLNCVISNNQVRFRGSGIFNSSGNLTVRYSTIDSNVKDPTYPSTITGGGIWNNGALTVTHSTFTGNMSYHPGGGIWNGGTAWVQDSTFSNNVSSSADAAGGAIYNAAGVVLTVQNSTFYGNTVGNPYNVTQGGAIYNGGTAILRNNTLASNSATSQGGGLYNAGTLSLYNTIVAQSTRGGDCANDGTLAVNDHNLIMDNSCSPLLSGDPLLGALINNGGSTKTMLPQSGSPAIDTGNSAECLSLDQRGYGRSNTCDIGAVETDPLAPETTLLNGEIVILDGDATPTPADGTDFGTVVIGDAVTHTFTISNSGPMTLSISSFNLSGAGAGDFNIEGLPAQIPPASAGTFQVIFAPIAENERTVTLTLVNNDPDETFYDFALQGTGLSADIAVLNNDIVIANGDATPAAADGTDFGSVAVGRSVTHTFTISSSGTAPLKLTGRPFVTFMGPAAADFSLVVSPTSPISPGETTTFQVRFAPTALGVRRATLLLPNTDPDAATYNFALQGATPCWFATEVQNTNDSGAGSLRQLLAEACPDATLEFAPGLAGQTLALTSAELNITQTVTIANPRAPGLVLSGNNARRIFTIQPGGVLTLSQLTLSHGKVSGGTGCPTYCGGSIYNAGNLTVLSSTLSRNMADFWGGGIYNTGTLQIQASTFSTNSVGITGNGGGIYNAGILTASNSTFSSNIGGYFGGGGGLYNEGSATVQQNTFSGNLAGAGGGLFNSAGHTLALINTLLANSALGGDCRNDGDLTVNDHNLVEDGECSAEVRGDPLLGPLADNSGATWTHALLYGSRAVDTGTGALCPATDQRGFPRPGPLTSRCDIGAFERQNVQPDAGLTLNVTPAAARPGMPVTYTLVFSNAGDGAATAGVVTATLPISVAHVNIGWSGVPITVQTGTRYILSVADLLPGTGGVITFTGVLSDPLPTGALHAAADITVQPADRNPNNNTATAYLTVLAGEVAPLAVDDVYTTPQDSALVIAAPGLLGNDQDSEPLTAAPATAPTHGTVAVQADGGFLYLPTAGFVGRDNFTYLVSDGTLTATGQVTVNITQVNQPVTARDDIAVVREDTVLMVAAPGILANDVDPDGGALATEILTLPFTGNLTLAANGAYTYTPPPDFNDVVSCTYRVRDTGNLSATATLYILVQAVNDAPTFVAGASQLLTQSTSAVTVPGWATGISAGPANERGQTLTFSVNTPQAALFAIQPTVDVSGTLRYTPAAGARGTATVTVTLRDSGGTAAGGDDTSPPQTFTITIQPGYQAYLPLMLHR